MPRRALCIHAHFYQPSREDPLTGIIPQECGAEPFSNWNEKINDNCYLPNAQLGNFEKISFNIGPTLTRWMESSAKETLGLITSAEKKNFGQWETGNAIAQPYHHTILPLASRQDKETQVRWGIADYRHTFGREPEGIWLPETAVDYETLAVLAENDIQYTILAPWQAAEEVDVRQPYIVELPGGKTIVVFFYHGGLSANLSFDSGCTVNADAFIENKLKTTFADNEDDQLIMLASDGELYGHHQPFRDKFLSYLLNGALRGADIEFTTPGRWLIDHQPVKHIQIREQTSWSCHEGVKRWSDECECTPHGFWKRPLRDFMDTVASLVDAQYLSQTRDLLKDPWTARNDYIRVVLGDESYLNWLGNQTTRNLTTIESQKLQDLFAAQFERQRMYTSCGWFFEDFDRIEPRNNIRYAAHALALTESACNEELLTKVRPLLRHVHSWLSSVTAENELNYAIKLFTETIG